MEEFNMNIHQPNDMLAGVCSDLFYNTSSSLAGNVGVYNLGQVLSMPCETFDNNFPLEMEEELAQ